MKNIIVLLLSICYFVGGFFLGYQADMANPYREGDVIVQTQQDVDRLAYSFIYYNDGKPYLPTFEKWEVIRDPFTEQIKVHLAVRNPSESFQEGKIGYYTMGRWFITLIVGFILTMITLAISSD